MNDEERTDDAETAPTQNHEERTDDAETAPTETIAAPDGPRRLTRSRGDRLLAGVAGGLGRYFSVDPLIFRIGFAVSVFFGGLGALAYLALALFVPAEPDGEGAGQLAPAQRSPWLAIAIGAVVAIVALSAAGSLFFWDFGWGGDGPWGLLVLIAIGAGAYVVLRDREPGQPFGAGRVIAAIALAFVAAIGLVVVAAVSAFAGATGNGIVIALLVIAIGALLAAAAFRGGARWLIAPAVALAIPLGVVAAADIGFADSVGERSYRPSSPAALAEGYELGVGSLTVDTRSLDWRDEQRIDLDLDLGVGEIVVLVPDHVCVTPDLRVGAGELEIDNRRLHGFGLEEVSTARPAEGPSLALRGDLDAGSLRVLDDYDDAFGPGGFGPADPPPGRANVATIC